MSRRARGTVGGLVGTFVLVLLSIPAARSGLDRIVVLTLAVYAVFVARRMLGVGARPRPDVPPPRDDDGAVDEHDTRLSRLDRSLREAAVSGEHFARVTRPALRRLVTDRLLVRRGIDVTTEPVRARQQMGEELWQMFAAAPEQVGPAPGPERLRLLVERTERL